MIKLSVIGRKRYLPVLVIDLLAIVLFALWLPGFATAANVGNLLAGNAVLWIVSIGMTFVVITAGIDLTVAAQVGLSGYLLAVLLNSGVGVVWAMVIVVIASFLCGALVNGMLIGKFRLNFFVVTLGTMTAFIGVVNIWSGTRTLAIDNATILTLGSGAWLGIPIVIWIMLATFIAFVLIQERTFFGRDIYAVGGSPSASRLSGIRVDRTLILVYGISACCAGVSAIIQVGQLGAASPRVGLVLPLQAAAAVLLGGTSFTGGVGGVVGTAAGVLFIAVVENGLGLAGISSFWQQIATGIILILAVSFDNIREATKRWIWLKNQR